jgi:hypothetical protein
MSDTRQHAHELIDQLPSPHLHAVVGLLEALLDPVTTAIVNAAVDDEPVTEEDRLAIEKSEAQFRENGGHGTPMEDVLSEFGLTLKDFPLEIRGQKS